MLFLFGEGNCLGMLVIEITWILLLPRLGL
jgi:hypothetical protein